jgi:oligoendopeptidase F
MEKELENEISLPIWSLNDIYQSFNEFNQELQTLENKIEKIKNEINNQDLVNNFIDKFLKILNSYTDIFETNRKLNAYLYCILSCDSTNEEANKYQGKLLIINSTLKTIQTQLESIIFQNKNLIISSLNENKDLKEYEYFIKKSLENFEHKMTLLFCLFKIGYKALTSRFLELFISFKISLIFRFSNILFSLADFTK